MYLTTLGIMNPMWVWYVGDAMLGDTMKEPHMGLLVYAKN